MAWSAWVVKVQEVRCSSSSPWLELINTRLVTVLCTTALLLQTLHAQTSEFSLLGNLGPPISFFAPCLFLGLVQAFSFFKQSRGFYLLMSALALLFTSAEMVFMVRDYGQLHCEESKCVARLVLHKYLCLRYLLDLADTIAVFKPGGRFLSPVHNMCRLWALSWRFSRDLLLGIVLTLPLLFASMPCLCSIHSYFLFHTSRRVVQACRQCLDKILLSLRTLFLSHMISGGHREEVFPRRPHCEKLEQERERQDGTSHVFVPFSSASCRSICEFQFSEVWQRFLCFVMLSFAR